MWAVVGGSKGGWGSRSLSGRGGTGSCVAAPCPTAARASCHDAPAAAPLLQGLNAPAGPTPSPHSRLSQGTSQLGNGWGEAGLDEGHFPVSNAQSTSTGTGWVPGLSVLGFRTDKR